MPVKNHGETTDTRLIEKALMEHAQLKWIVTQDKELVHVAASLEPLIPRFLSNRKNEVVRMREALTVQDFETVRTVAHGMKDAGGSYGFDRITEIAAAVEQAAKTDDALTIECHLPALSSYLAQVKVVCD